MKKYFGLILVISLVLNSCGQKIENEITEQDHLIMATLWYQKSSEMKAIYYQSFNWAKLRIDMDEANNHSDRKKAVVVDIDETMLDNSPDEAVAIQTGVGFNTKRWTEWCSLIDAKPLPGAVEFSKYAESKGIEVFYISNRSVDVFDVTLKNLQKEDFAFADSTHLLLKTTTSSKKIRRDKLRENFEIILLIGDNMGDFSDIFEDRSINYGFDVVDENIEKFGDKFIVLPNPMYGAWEKVVFNNQNGLSTKEKYQLRKKGLVGY